MEKEKHQKSKQKGPVTRAWFQKKRSQIAAELRTIGTLEASPYHVLETVQNIREEILAAANPKTDKRAARAAMLKGELEARFIVALKEAIERLEKGNIPDKVRAMWRDKTEIARDPARRERFLAEQSLTFSPREVEYLRIYLRHAGETSESELVQAMSVAYSALRDEMFERLKQIPDSEAPKHLGKATKGLYKKAMDYQLQGNYKAAITELTRLAELNPNDDCALFLRANIYSLIDNLPDAINDLTAVINLRPSDMAYSSRGMAYFNAGNLDAAISDLTAALGFTSDASISMLEVYSTRGEAYSGKGDYERATRDFTAAILLDPTNPLRYVARSLSLKSNGEDRLALMDINVAIEIFNLQGTNPDITDNLILSYLTRAGLLIQLGDFDQSIEDSTKVIELSPELPEGYELRALGYFSIQQFNTAIEDATKAIELKPESAMAYCTRASAYEALENYEGAERDLNMAAKLDKRLTDELRNEWRRKGETAQ